MRFHPRQNIIAVCVAASLLTVPACETLAERAAGQARPPSRARTASSPARTVRKPAARTRRVCTVGRWPQRQACLRYVHALHVAAILAYLDAVWRASWAIPPSLAGIAQCIKDHESGNYAESSHPQSGSGAYQFVPGTWRHWYGLWRDAVAFRGSDYPYAYQAPPVIQDAVLVYTLTHGGAGNWSNAYGFDPCTAGMP